MADRKPRRDRRGPLDKMGQALPVKLTPTSRQMLTMQARKAGFRSAAKYLRDLATKDRVLRGLTAWDYNKGASPTPPKPTP
jgi:hypothetical protein